MRLKGCVFSAPVAAAAWSQIPGGAGKLRTGASGPLTPTTAKPAFRLSQRFLGARERERERERGSE